MRRGLALVVLLWGMTADAAPSTPEEHRRGPEQTFLTFPEWFLVFSPAEYAGFVADLPPSEFPFWDHIRQFWRSYAAVTRETSNGEYAFNGGYHVMINVIGISTTVEYAIRLAYETLIGHVTEALAGERTAEDDYAAHVARDYVDFIRERPWYEYSFASKLAELWRTVPATGPNMLRKWERRYALTTEYAVKAAYGWLIGKATHAGYDAPLPSTAVVVAVHGQAPALELLPRYQAFTPAATELALAGASFEAIAGNPGSAKILLSVIAPDHWEPAAPARALFTQALVTQRGWRRVAVVTSVGSLAHVLRQLPRESPQRAGAPPQSLKEVQRRGPPRVGMNFHQSVEVEHIFDY